ncbi:MAG: hypothetical protein EPO68_04015, partial [Planctomycetota bacterium]
MLSLLLACIPVVVPAAQSGASEFPFPELAVKLRLPMIEQLAPSGKPSQNEALRGEWMGRLGPSELRVRFSALNTAEYGFLEPEDVVEVWRESLRDASMPGSDAKDLEFTFDAVRSYAAQV